jgi:hypothetical protein
MKKRKVFLLSMLTIAILAGIGTGFVLLLYHEPAFYRRCEIPPGEERVKSANEFNKPAFQLYNIVANSRDGDPDYKGSWQVPFAEKEVNSFLQENFFKTLNAKSLERHGISDVRVAFEDNLIRLGFRYGTKPWQTVMSFDMHVWLVPKEINVMAIELVGRHAGALPVSAQSLLTMIAETLHTKEVDISWYRHNGNPVALVRFQSEGGRPSFRFCEVAAKNGSLIVVGNSLDPAAQTTH